jgi:HK97 family phage major capsid protein
MVPLAGEFIVGDEKLADEVRQTTKGGSGSTRRAGHMRRKMAFAGATKALSWMDETVGGALVAPPMMGELIELLRNNEVLMAAGARVLPMPPQGRITFPRQTSAMTAFHVGESQVT